ncbi:MAG: hypothetical protein EXQ99_06200 [Alphaproteobacteria bacterium]|nr:hypothetical protein [Alphaproteobacteria bacterium]
MTYFAALDAELALWAKAGRHATVWWRHDDAGIDSPAFVRLLALASAHDAPRALAVIPLKLDAASAARINAARQISVLQHGFRHENRAEVGAKKCEFPDRLPLDAVLAGLDQGRAQLQVAFDGRALSVFVPPWNRLASALIPALASIGLHGLSTYRARQSLHAAPGLCQVNCHVDVIDWPGTRGFTGEQAAIGLFRAHLQARREARVDADEPTGLLTHHAVHDEPTWHFLDRLLAHLARHPVVRVLPATALFQMS